MRQTKINLFKATHLYLARKVVFNLEAITNSVTLSENKNDLKITNGLSESICDEILDKLKKKYQNTYMDFKYTKSQRRKIRKDEQRRTRVEKYQKKN